MYMNLVKTVEKNAKTTLEQTREGMRKYYDRRATPQPDIKIGDLIMLHTKNIKSKRPTRKFTPRLDSSFKILDKQREWGIQTRYPGSQENPLSITRLAI